MKKKFLILCLMCVACVSLMARERPKVALVLGGGGAKGAATVGVLKYVEQSGVPVDMVVGTSIGSIVGGLYSLGYTGEQLDSMFRSQEWLSMCVGSLMGDSIVCTLRRMTGGLGYANFDELPIPYRCVAVDLNQMREVVLSEGDLAQAMRASMAVPLVFKPVKMGNMKLVDGGMLNNLPVDVAKAMGADIVIAVDLTVNKHGEKDMDEDDLEDDELFGSLKKFNLVKAAAWPLLRPDLRKYQRNCRQADIYINPRLKGYGAHDFTPAKIAEMIALGERAGKEKLKEMKKLRKKLR